MYAKFAKKIAQTETQRLKRQITYRPRFFDQVGHQKTTYASIGNKHFLTKPLSDLPKLQTELTKIGHIFRKQSTI